MYQSPVHRSSVVVRRSTPRRPGFTLIEILVVVVILATCAAIVVPTISDRSDLKASTAARSLVADLLYAQNRSISTCSWTYVGFDTSHNCYSMYSSLPSGLLTHPVYKNPYTIAYGANSNFPNVALGAVTLNSSTDNTVIGFDPLGTPYMVPSSGGPPVLLAGSAIPVTCQAASLTVIVDPITGQIRIQ